MTSVAAPDHLCNPQALEWLDACCQAGRWPGVLGFLLWRIGAADPDWCHRGPLLELWREIEARYPDWIALDEFVDAWPRLVEANLVYSFADGGWSTFAVIPSGSTPAPPSDRGVYFVREGASGPIKIGCSKNVLKRISYLQVGASEPLELLAVFHGDRDDEKALHAMFAHCRVRGEWFEAEPVLAWLASTEAP